MLIQVQKSKKKGLLDLYKHFFVIFAVKKDDYVGRKRTRARYAWVGLAFERVCMQHIRQIKHKLGIGGVLTTVSSWSVKADPVYGQGAQIDLLIERADNVVNICEIKFSQDKYAISQDYSQNLAHKIERFLQSTKTRKTLHLTMITVHGLAHNEYRGMVQSEVVADDLFHE